MSALWVGLALALAATVALNASFLLQHAGSRDAPAITMARPAASLRGLLASRLWLAGLVLGLGGWVLHVGALAHAPLSLVQAWAAGGLVLAAPVAAFALRERLDRRERIGLGVVALGLAGLAVGVTPSGAAPSVPLLLGGIGLAALGAALLTRVRGARRPHALGAAAGLLYGAGDAATKMLTGVLHGGLAAGLLSPWVLVLALLTSGAFVAFQRGLQTGAAVPVIGLMTAGTNLAAIALGLVAFAEPLGATPAIAGLHALAFVAIGAGGWLLAPAQALTSGEGDRQAGTEVKAGSRSATTPPSTRARSCSAPTRPRLKGTATTKTTSEGTRTTTESPPAAARRRATSTASPPRAPAHTHETP